MKTYDIIGFGALNVDRLGTVPQFTSEGEALVEYETRAPGGSAANTIAALGRLGQKAAFIGTIGDDAEGKLHISAFKADHVDTTLIRKKSGNSGVVLGLVDKKGHRLLNIFPGINSDLTSRDMPAPSTIHTKIMHVSSFVNTKQLSVQESFISKLHKTIIISFAPGIIYCRLGMTRLTPILRRCAIVFLTKEELQTLTGKENLTGTKLLHDLGVSTVVITDGSNGCFVSIIYCITHIPTVSVSAVDTTGAGDAFIAGYLWGVLRQKNLRMCADAGNTLAGFCVRKSGARVGLPLKKEFERKIMKIVDKKTILIVGSGGREHAIGWKLAKSKNIGQLYFAPGNGGTSTLGQNLPIAADNVDGLLQFAKTAGIDVTVVGPEAPLSLGIVNKFTQEGLQIFGPTREAAQLETSKVWASEFLKRHNLPRPASKTFNDPKSAIAYSGQYNGNVVIKADGLCQGKGVFVCDSMKTASDAIRSLMINKTLGRAGDRIVIQEKLVGKEVSVMVFSDGTRVAPIIATSDYKRLGDGNVGPNTGSMGSMAPSDNATPQQLKKIYQLLQYAVQCMKKEGRPYQGVLYAGLMIAEGKPYILEFNCRFGDPETEVQLPLLKSDLLSIVEACLNGSLSPRLVSFSNQTCVCVVLAAPGYPGHYLKNIQIVGLAKPHNNTVTVFHAGTSRSESTTITTGGRVLGITAWESSIEKARAQVYALIGKQISFNGMQYRTDIGL